MDPLASRPLTEERWAGAFAAAESVAAAAQWRARVAREVCCAADGVFAAVMTCPPSYWEKPEFDTYPETYASVTDEVSRRFVPKIDSAGEGWRFAVRRHGLVYAPLATAIATTLANDLRSSLLTPLGVSGYVVTFFIGTTGDLLGLIALGARCPDHELLSATEPHLRVLSHRASSTLEKSVALARGLGAVVPHFADTLRALTPRERQIAQLAAEGFSNLNIGARLDIAPSTVGVHLRRVFRKLAVCSRMELAAHIRPTS